MNELILLSILFLCACFDIRYQKIPMAFIYLLSIVSICFFLMGESPSILKFVLGILPGVFCGILSGVTKEKIGWGDSFLIGASGIYLGFYQSLAWMLGSFFLAAICAIVLLIFKKATQKTEIPLAPFLFLVYGGMCL